MSENLDPGQYNYDDALEESSRLLELSGKNASSPDLMAAEELDEEREGKKYYLKGLDILRKHKLPNFDFRPYSANINNSFQSHVLRELIDYYEDILSFRELGMTIDRSGDGIRKAQAEAVRQGKDYYGIKSHYSKLLKNDFKEVTDYYSRRTTLTLKKRLEQGQ